MITAQNLHKKYRIGTVSVHALRGVSLEIREGEFVAIMGPSGSGKSTLMHILGLLDRPDEGGLYFSGADVTRLTEEQLALLRNQAIGFVFQQFNLLARRTAASNVLLARFYSKTAREGGFTDALEALAHVGLKDRTNHRPNELSGGQQQRVAIARALVNRPRILMADEPTGNLDSHAREEIMKILSDRHAQGQTVIVVTHDDAVARHATRILRMMDGKIESDEKKGEAAGREGAPLAVPEVPREKFSVRDIAEYFGQALETILAHKMRSLLSMLGVLIGVGCVIAMLALGRGARESVMQELSRFGTNILSIRPGSEKSRGIALEQGAVTRLALEDVAAIRSGIEGVRYVGAQVSGQGQIEYTSENWNTRILGTMPEYVPMREIQLTEGRFFTADENKKRRRVAVVGATIVRELLGEGPVIGETIKINRTEFQVIGVLPSLGADAFRDRDDMILIPLETAMYRVLSRQYLDQVEVQVADPKRIPEVQEQIAEMIRRRYRIPEGKEDTFTIRDNTQIQEALSGTTKTFSVLLGTVAAISLLVGGIGIMNIMLVSVTERTREIGLRKALGATSADILVQFLVESVVVTFFGGIAGMLLGMAVSWTITLTAGWATVIQLDSVFLSFVFSVGVGILFGLWPAKTASRLDPITALRYE
ncbi:MAG: ABC transporter permease [Candidatus Omnitrophota bacterium]